MSDKLIVMLNEMAHVRQISNDYFRRGFTDENLHLLIWYKPDQTIYGFQLSYDQKDQPRALTWMEDRGFSHAFIDEGEESPLANRSPVLRPSADFGGAELLSGFHASAQHLPPVEREFVRRKLVEVSVKGFY